MSDIVFRAMLNWMMCSDPWAAGDQDEKVLKSFLDEEAQSRGYDRWVEAYHEFK